MTTNQSISAASVSPSKTPPAPLVCLTVGILPLSAGYDYVERLIDAPPGRRLTLAFTRAAKPIS